MFTRKVARFARNRYFSATVEGKPAEAATAEGAAPAAWSKTRKYGIFGVPLAIAAVVATDIVCNVRHRAFLEEYCPSFVGLVRKYYGFDDEDDVEKSRVDYVTSFHNKTIRVYAGNTRGRSDNVELTIDGTLLMDELMSQMNAQLQQAGQQPERSPVRLLSRLSFDEVAGDNAYGSSTAAQPSPALSAVVSKQDEVSVQLFDQHYTPQHSSVWSGPAQVRTLRDGLSGLSGDNNSNNGSTNFTEIVRTRVLNPTADFLEGLHVYARDGTQAVPIGALSSDTGRKAAPARKRAAPSQATAQADMVKIQARQRVNALQEYIQALENEKRTGARDIDEIQSEINRKRGEITELSRKHLNYFYYF